MKKRIRLVVICMCMLSLLSLFGCKLKPEEPFMLDGPGMEKEPDWISFTLTGVSENGNGAFSFTVNSAFYSPTLTGFIRDDYDGTLYIVDKPMEIPQEFAERLWELAPDELEDVTQEQEAPKVYVEGYRIGFTVVDKSGAYTKQIPESMAISFYNVCYYLLATSK